MLAVIREGTPRRLMATCTFSSTSSNKVRFLLASAGKLGGDRRLLTGGSVDLTDEDGDTPLYTVESVETARFLLERGATVNRTNNEGISVCRLSLISFLRLSDCMHP
jgi:hypothetical protein